jgi:hypothetical protein
MKSQKRTSAGKSNAGASAKKTLRDLLAKGKQADQVRAGNQKKSLRWVEPSEKHSRLGRIVCAGVACVTVEIL